MGHLHSVMNNKPKNNLTPINQQRPPKKNSKPEKTKTLSSQLHLLAKLNASNKPINVNTTQKDILCCITAGTSTVAISPNHNLTTKTA